MNNKYNIGDKVLWFDDKEVLTIKEVNADGDLITYTLTTKDGGRIYENAVEEYISPYIEEGTQEDETITIDISKACDNLSDEEKKVVDNFKGFDKIEVDSLKIEFIDYEKEYNILLEEHEQTKELLEIAKVALKLTTELISTND